MSANIRNRKAALGAHALWLFLLLGFAPAGVAADLREMETANAKGQWNDATEISYEMMAKNPGDVAARLQGAYALFQKSYSNSALLWIKPLKSQDWKTFPQGADRFAEIISLFQKKVPLTLLPGRLEQMSFDEASPYLHDELRFAKGRAAFEKHDAPGLKKYLQEIAKGSRYFTQAQYLLGASAVREKDYKTAISEFSKIFEPILLDQSTEFWRDLGTQMTTHWGANLRIALDAQAVRESEKVGELALLGLARSAYGLGQHETALGYYSRVPQTSAYYARAALERIWTLLALNRHEEAQKAAAELAVNDQTFQSLEARILRALILTDVGRTEESRVELESFMKAYQNTKAALQNYETTQVDSTLPPFIKADLAGDIRLRTITEYQDSLNHEMESLRKEDMGAYPVYSDMAGKLEPLVLETKASIYKIVQEHVSRRRADLETLYVQSKLIRAEMYLEDREKLRAEFKNLAQTDTARQADHDRRLVELLQGAVQTVDDILPQVDKNKTRLEFRQSELLWELSTAHGIVAQASHDQAEQVMADQIRKRSLRIAEEIVQKHPEYEERPQTVFFVGYARTETGGTAEGVRVLEDYVKTYPRDPHVPDAYRILADLKFDENRFSEAEALYERILAFPESPIVGYAFYKIGWCAYNRKDFARALLGLEKAVRWAVGNAQAQLLSLKRESRRDLISLYAEVGDARKALDYFSKFFQGDTAGWIGELATELDRIGQFEKSADLYKTLVALEPGSPDNVTRQASVINGQYHLHRWANVLEESRKLVEEYKPQLEQPQPEVKPAAAAEKILRETVLAQLFEFRKNPASETAPRVNKLDEYYLAAFDRWPDSQEPLYEHGLFLLSQNKVAEAVDVFRKHWAQFKETLKEPSREEALRNLIYALDKTGDVAKNEQELLQYTAEYGAAYPKTKYARSVQFLSSTVYFKQGKHEEGIRESRAIFEQNPADDIGKRAFKNLRVAYYDLKDWERTYHWAESQLASKAPGMKLYSDDLKTVRMEALFQWADQSKEDIRSAKLFLQLAGDPDMKRLSEKALFNAFVRYSKADSEIDALDVASRLEKDFPQSQMLAEISGPRAAFYQEAGDYVHAYPLLQDFAQHHNKSVDPATVLKAELNLALIAEALGKTEEARKRYEGFLKSLRDQESPQAKEARRGLARLSRHAAKQENWQGWAGLEKLRIGFENSPTPSSGDLATRIKKGGETLERVAKQFADASTSAGTPAYFAFESYCTLPSLYASYGQAVLKAADDVPDLKDNERQELRIELSKVSDPVQVKARSLADQCLLRSAESLHDGPRFRGVLERWGWMSDSELKKRAEGILNGLNRAYPWLDPGLAEKTDANEKELLEKHLQRKASEESWYQLARARWSKPALSRLTLVDALALYPSSGRILNALGALDEDPGVYELAAQKGSAAAWANLAYFHLNGGRLTQAERALEQGLAKSAFDSDPGLRKNIQELEKK